MGYYHLSASIVSRGRGRSAVACAAYRSGQALADLRYGTTHDYGRKTGIAECGIVAPVDAPHWAHDRERLWNAVEAVERRKDSQLAREFVLAFPDGINQEDRRSLVETFIAQEIVPRGLVADWAIHAPNRAGDERNWHAHVMTTLRSLTADGFTPTKDRSLNAPDQLIRWREGWAELQNQVLERVGLRDAEGKLVRVDHRSYAAQGVHREPTVHLGVHATAMERRGRSTELGDVNRAVQCANEARHHAEEASRRRSLEKRILREIEAQRGERGLDLSP